MCSLWPGRHTPGRISRPRRPVPAPIATRTVRGNQPEAKPFVTYFPQRVSVNNPPEIQMPEQPNILIIMADQLTAGALPAYGNRVAKTPHIDALAREGVVFDSFYCNSPLCAPSRFSFLAGQLPSKIGAYDNAAEFPAQIPTFAHYLRQAGYQTVLSGKMHFLWPGPAARVRGAPDHGHLSGGLRLDPGLDAI